MDFSTPGRRTRRVGGRVPNANATGPSPGLSSRAKGAIFLFFFSTSAKSPGGAACGRIPLFGDKKEISRQMKGAEEDYGALKCRGASLFDNYENV